MKLNFILGTAAELIKVYPLIQLGRAQGHQVRVISTGQSGENFVMQYRDFGLPENELCHLFGSSQRRDLARIGDAVIWFARVAYLGMSRRRIRQLLLGNAVGVSGNSDRSVDEYVIVHGDTLSTLVGAWLGRRCGVRVVHVEAGLRSPSLWNPFPEEITRRLVSRLADFHMCSDMAGVRALGGEAGDGEVATGGSSDSAVTTNGVGFSDGRESSRRGSESYSHSTILQYTNLRGVVVFTSGNTLRDTLELCGSAPRSSSTASTGRAEGSLPTTHLLSKSPTLAHMPESGFVLTNLHRFENLSSPVRWAKIIDTVERAAEHNRVIFVAHPQTRHKLNSDKDATDRLQKAGVLIRDRMPFSEFVSLLKHARFLISDGGSNQEECSYLGKPCLLLRDATERSEGLESCCVLSRFDDEVIRQFLANPEKYATTPTTSDRSSSQIILDVLAQHG